MELTDTKQEGEYQSSSIVKPTRCINVSNLLYWSDTLHVSDGLSVHHQELKTVYTATGMSNRYCCLLASGYPLASRTDTR